MNKLLKSLIAISALLITTGSYSQASLWTGHIVWSTGNTELHQFDTTGGVYTFTSSLTLNDDIAANLSGVAGLALNPIDEVMWILYQDDAAGANNRNIGTVDLTTGDITTIGSCGNMDDIGFKGGQLFAIGGNNLSSGNKDLYRVDMTTGATTLIGNLNASWATSALAYHFDDDELYHYSPGEGQLFLLDTMTAAETPLGAGTSSWANSATFKNDSILIIGNGSSFDERNINTDVYTTGVSTHPSGARLNAMAFDQTPFTVIPSGPLTFCDNQWPPLELASSLGATTYQWILDGADVPGATDSTWLPVASGEYAVIVDGTDTSGSKTVTVLVAPGADFTETPNPVLLGTTPSGVVNFTNTSAPDGHEYWWDFGGFFTTLENPNFSFPTAGFHTAQLIVYDTITGCSDTAAATITVIDDVGIGEYANGIKIYPIPTDDFITISNEGSENFQVALQDMAGRLIEQRDLFAGSGSQTKFDLSELEGGVYLVRVFNDEGERFYKVVKR